MTEQEWFNSCSYYRMYDLVRNQATTRQLRLYMVACCRLEAGQFFDPRILRTLETAERCADEPRAEAVVSAIQFELTTASKFPFPQTSQEGELAQVVLDTWHMLDEWLGGPPYQNTRDAIAHAAFMSLRDKPGEILTGGGGDAAEYCALAINSAELLQLGVEPPEEVFEDFQEDFQKTETEIRRAITNILQDIFGNPFRPVTIAPTILTWHDSTIPRLAQAIYDDRQLPSGTFDPVRMNILADALLDAGCDNEDIIAHCRSDKPHVRGCWVVDLLLGKS